MRFTTFFVAATAFFGAALSAPAGDLGAIEKEILSKQIGDTIAQFEHKYNIDNVNLQLEHLLGATYHTLDLILPVHFGNKLHDLLAGGASMKDVQAVGQAVGMLHLGVGLGPVNSVLAKATNGFYNNLARAIGVTDLEKALKLCGGTYCNLAA